MQLIPETAERFGVGNLFDPAQNVEGGTTYLKWLLDRYNGDLRKDARGIQRRGARGGSIRWCSARIRKRNSTCKK